jgi:hypothetical protein
MIADRHRDIRKVAVAFDPACSTPALLEAATQLAISLGAELEALLVDDPDIARMSQLPFGRLFELHSGKAELLDMSTFRSRRAGSVARARATLRRTAERHRVTCTALELPGLALSDATMKSNAELFVIAGFHGKFGGTRSIDRDAVQIAIESTGSVLLVSQLPVNTGRILVVSDDSPLAERADAIARRIAQRDPLGDRALVGRLDLDWEALDDIVGRIASLSPTLVVTGISDSAAVATLHERLERNPVSVLTVR